MTEDINGRPLQQLESKQVIAIGDAHYEEAKERMHRAKAQIEETKNVASAIE
jgi:hypothetical protein